MNQETIKYCAYLKKDEVTWKELLTTARALIHGDERNKASENPARDLLNYYNVPDWDFDGRKFTEAFLLEVDADHVAEIICDAAKDLQDYPQVHKAIDRELAAKKIVFLDVIIGGFRKIGSEDTGGRMLINISNEPEAA